MLRSSNLIIAGVVVAFCVSSALATPVINGDVASNEYDIVVDDATGEEACDFHDTGLDIETMQFDRDNDWAYMAMTVVSEPFDTDGDPTSFFGETSVLVMFYSDDDGNDSSYFLEINIMGTDIEVELMHYNGSTWDDVTLADADYDIEVGDALELRLASGVFNPDNAQSFSARLDGDGNWDDDIMDHNLIPEPATLALLGIGGIGVLIRRRRK